MKPKTMEVLTTYGIGDWDQKFTQTVAFMNRDETENKVVNLYPEITYEVFEGFGGAITESAGYVYSQMTEAQKRELMEAYFSPERMNYRLARIPMDSCDFSLGQYTGFERVEQYILPMLDDAERTRGGRLNLMLSPWSPPAEWKTNGIREQGGKLKPEHYGAYAEYLCRYILWYREKGYRVTRISLQNEPKAVQTWDSCIFTAAEEKVFLRDFMWPAMERHNLTDIEVFLWDHNKERVYEWMRNILDGDTEKMVAGAAFHWYSGDHFEALDLCRKQFPDKKLILSENCIEFYKFDAADAVGSAIKLTHELMGDLNHGMTAFYDWNLLLDENGGPNYVGNFSLAPFLYDTKNKKLCPQLVQQYFEHFTHYILPGSVRIASTRYSEQVEATAWRLPDGSIVLILLNKSRENQPVVVRMEQQEAGVILYPESITTCVIS